MYTVSVLVKNLTSNFNELTFSKFRLVKIEQDDDNAFNQAKRLFAGGHVDEEDWVYVRCYSDKVDNLLAKITLDVEEILFLLRLFKVGDLVFLYTHIQRPDGTQLRQLPYRVMSDIPPFREYELQQEECSQFDNFLEIMSQKNYSSTWFQTARRFFLYGGSKEFNPRHNEVDRIVDYMIVLESILVPEKGDFIGRRLRERAISLLKSHIIDDNDAKRLIKDFYDIRSTIVHGADVSSFKNGVLDRHIEFESIVRKVMIEAVKTLPEDDENREKFLNELFDVSDQNRANKVYQDFCALKDTNEKKRCFNLISTRLTKTENPKPKTENK